MRQTQMPGQGAYITAEIAKIVANGGGFLTQDALLNPPYANNNGQQNPLYGYFRTITGLPTSGGQADYWRASSYGINVLQSNSDPRLPFIYSPDAKAALHTRVAYWGVQTILRVRVQYLQSVPAFLVSASQPAVLISAAESNFLQAGSHCKVDTFRVMMAHWNSTPVSRLQFQAYLGAGDATAYLAQNNINTNFGLATTTQAKIAVIIRQKWIAENGVTPFEIWCDYRRLGLPADIHLYHHFPYKAGNTGSRQVIISCQRVYHQYG